MSLSLYHRRETGPGSSTMHLGNLSLLAAYENGSVVLREYIRKDKEISVEGEGWDIVWASKLHVESSMCQSFLFLRCLTLYLVMAMRVSRAHDFALTVSADHIIGRYDLTVRFSCCFPQFDCSKFFSFMQAEKSSTEQRGVAYRTSHPGIGSVAIRDDGKVCAVGGWDGRQVVFLSPISVRSNSFASFALRIRLYSTKSLKPLGTLRYHKSACQCVEFARSLEYTTKLEDEGFESKDDLYDDEEMGSEEKLERSRWLIAGAKDNRLSIWHLMTFQK